MENRGIEIEPLVSGLEIHLPRRDLGDAKKAGWLLVAFGTFLSLFMTLWIGTPVSWGIDLINRGGPWWFGALFIGFGCLGLGGLFFAVKLIALGVVVLRNNTRCLIRVTSQEIISEERFGWFRHRTKVRRHSVKQLFVLPLVSAVSSERPESTRQRSPGFVLPIFAGNLENLYVISTGKRAGSRLAMGYPKGILDEAAGAIATELNRVATDAVKINRDPVLSGLDSDTRFVTAEDLAIEAPIDSDFDLPDQSNLEVVEEGDSVVYRIPERGLWKGSNGLFAFSILWNGFMVIWTFGLVVAANNANGNGPGWIFLFMDVLFWAIGVSMLIASIYMAKQSALIGVRDGLLFIERKTIFDVKWTEFTADEVCSIEMASSNMEVNDVPVMNLTIQPHEGKPVGMFSQLDNEELQWLAQQLRRALGVEAASGICSAADVDTDEPIELLTSTDIDVQEDFKQTTVLVPPFSVQGIFVLKPLGILFGAIPIPLFILLSFLNGLEPFLLLFSSILTMIGVAMFLTHRFVTSRRFRIEANSERLEVEVRGFLSDRDISLDRSEVLSVEIADSGTRLNNRMLECLRIRGTDGQGISMMTGRDRRELVYVARLIRKRLASQDEV